jgi:hypothetical protein
MLLSGLRTYWYKAQDVDDFFLKGFECTSTDEKG